MSVVELRASDDGPDTVGIMTRVLDSLPGLQTLDLVYSYAKGGWTGTMKTDPGATGSAAALRRAKISSGTVEAIMILLDRASYLESLELYLYWMPSAGGPDLRTTLASLPRLRQLVLRAEALLTGVEPEVFPQLLAFTGHSLRSLSLRVDFVESLEVIHQLASHRLTNSLVHLALTAHDPSLASQLTACEHRAAELKQARSFIRAFPCVTHLSLQGFHSPDLAAILDVVTRPLCFLAVSGKSCGSVDSVSVQSMLESGHHSVMRLRWLALYRHGVDDEAWLSVRALCQRRRAIVISFEEAGPLLVRRGVLLH